MKRTAVAAILAGLLALGAASQVRAQEPTVYEEISNHYEFVRQALLVDSLDGVAEGAAHIRDAVEELGNDFDVARAGVAPARGDECRELLPEIAAAADQVAAGENLEEVRAAFFDLSKPLGRYRKLVGDLDSKVMFCPMVKKAWIQPEGEIGNPYLGSEMPDCGQPIAD